MQLLLLSKSIRLVTAATQKQVHPLLSSKLLAQLYHSVQIEVGHLNGLEAYHMEGTVLRAALAALLLGLRLGALVENVCQRILEILLVRKQIFDTHNAPDTALKNL